MTKNREYIKAIGKGLFYISVMILLYPIIVFCTQSIIEIPIIGDKIYTALTLISGPLLTIIGLLSWYLFRKLSYLIIITITGIVWTIFIGYEIFTYLNYL